MKNLVIVGLLAFILGGQAHAHSEQSGGDCPVRCCCVCPTDEPTHTPTPVDSSPTPVPTESPPGETPTVGPTHTPVPPTPTAEPTKQAKDNRGHGNDIDRDDEDNPGRGHGRHGDDDPSDNNDQSERGGTRGGRHDK